ncbi:MAG: hypothetical protein RR312_06200 [Bacteroidales bacterium]
MVRFIYIFMCMLACSCVKMPKNNYNLVSDVTYSFNGEEDMLSLFQLHASYLDANNTIVSENIESLPWTKAVRFNEKSKASLSVTFKSVSNIPDKKNYKVGYSGDIKYKKSDVYEKLSGENPFLLTKTAPFAGNKSIKFNVVFSTPWQAQQAALVIPYLKYNKKFACSYTIDDSAVGAYAKLWRRINKKWIDKIEYFHKQCKPTTGYIPNNTLGYTDGCGNEKRFPLGVAIWPNAWNEWNKNGFIVDASDNTYSPYITWEELADILDFGGSVYYHNVDEIKYSNADYLQIIKGMDDDRDVTYSKLGRYMKVMALPDGNKNYVLAANNNNNIVMSRGFLSEDKIYLNNITSLYKKYIATGGNGETIDTILGYIASQSKSTNPYWLSFVAHGADEALIMLFEQVNKLYGKDGDDNIWFATFDEVYEYVAMRNSAKIDKTVEGNIAKFEISVPIGANFYYNDLSFIIDQGNIKEINPVSENIIGLSHSNTLSGELININFNENSLSLAEKYTSLFENTYDTKYKEDAKYFVSSLLPRYAQVYKQRIDNVTETPAILSQIIINGGDKKVYSKFVDINLTVVNKPTFYKIWEGNNIDGGTWIKYDGGTCIFELSNSYGYKKINVKVKDVNSESKTISSTVEYIEISQNGNFSKYGIIEYIKKYNGFIYKKELIIK